MMRALITGASGFAGSHLLHHLHQKGGYELFGTVFGDVSKDLDPILPQDHRIALNLLNRDETLSHIQSVKPDLIFHLAALASPAASFKDPQSTYTNNIIAQLNILDAAILLEKKPRVLVIGTAEEYGKIQPHDLPINETVPLNPMSPYAVSKITQDFMGLMYFHTYNLPIIRVRPFNHIGERQTEAFVAAAFARQISLIEADKQPPIIQVGNLSATRDFTDVKDMVAAYELALLQGLPGEVYNLGSGHAIAINDLLNQLLALSTRPIEVQVDTAKYTPADVPILVCDNQKFCHLTGWQTQIPLPVTLKRVLDYWRQQTT